MFKKILIANRGEVALRIIRACKELGVRSVAVFSEADRGALHTRIADEAIFIGPTPPSQSYLNIQRILETSKLSGSEAIHPGYGFLSQIPEFARQCETNEIEFIGPPSGVLQLMGNKLMARRTMEKAGIIILPGSTGEIKTPKEAKKLAEHIGYPIIIKAVYGGGGKGLRIVKNERGLRQGIELARLEAQASFGNSKIYIEKFLEKPRHIEVQILADRLGNIIHLGERECSIQRRHQKLIEEAPSPIINEEKRSIITKYAIEAAKVVNYVNAGTVEFLMDKDGAFYFLEMNTRLQVEHLVTEMITGVDIVKEQIRIASGEELSIKQSDITFKDHALNCRINAENPNMNFEPSPGTVTHFHLPGGPGIRVDTALQEGCEISLFYDSLIAKLAVWGRNREESILRMRSALEELSVDGIKTTASFLRKILDHKDYLRGNIHTSFADNLLEEFRNEEANTHEDAAVLSAALAVYFSCRQKGTAVIPSKKRRTLSLWKAAGRMKNFSGRDLRWIR